MIQSQINRDIRLVLADQILLSKAKKDLTFAQLADGTGLSEAFVTAALLGQHALPADEIGRASCRERVCQYV